ncbi:MAG: D-2-hydroxyacid dehydrogenase family protein [Jatrophihabitans sp.]
MIRVAVLDDYADAARPSADWTRLDGVAEVTFFPDHVADEDELADRLAPFDVVALMRERTAFPASLLSRLPALRLLITTGMGNAAVDVASAAQQNILVCGTRGAGGPAAPEFTWGLILAVTRGIRDGADSVRAGGWSVRPGPQLRGTTLGLLGLGRIGGTLAGYAQAFGMDVVAWSENLTDERAAEVGAVRVDRAELFRRASVVVVCTRLSDRTRGLVGAEELALLGADGYLVNTSRGPIVDETALVSALRNETIAGAALDVFEVEPLPDDHPLRTLPNALVTPHLGYVSREAFTVMYTDVIDGVLVWAAGTPQNLVTA